MWALPHTDICQCYRLMVRHTSTLPIPAADKVYQVAQVASIRVLQDHFGIILDARSEVSTSPTLANSHTDNVFRRKRSDGRGNVAGRFYAFSFHYINSAEWRDACRNQTYFI